MSAAITEYLDSDVTLPKLDTVHDFWKQRGAQAQDADDEDDDTDNTKLAQVQDKIVALLDAGNIQEALTTLTQGYVTSATSDYERKVERWYEYKEPELFADCKNEITFEEIIELSKDQAEELYSDDLVNILEISSRDGRSFGNLTDKEKKQIADFILRFMFYNEVQQQCKFMFDGKSGIIGKIFRDIEQAIQVMTPQNVGDSAPTSFTSLKGRLICEFAREDIKGNFFTKDLLSMSFRNTGFGDKNKYGFELRINDKSDPSINFIIPFSQSQTEGPSVNYLVDIMTCTPEQVLTKKPKKSKTLRIGEHFDVEWIKDNNVMESGELPFDLKRIGDYEQLRAALALAGAAAIIFCTIDILCSLFARLNKQRCIFHVGEKLVLYRFKGNVQTDPVAIEQYRAKRSVENYKRYKIIESAGEQLKEQLIHITKAIINGRFISNSNRNIKAEYIVSSLIIIQLLNIWNSLYRLNISFVSLTHSLSSISEDHIRFLEEFIEDKETADSTESGVVFTDSIGRIYNVSILIDKLKFDTNALYELFKRLNMSSNELKVLMNRKTGQLNLKKNIMDTKYIFLKKGLYSLFNFNMEAFSKLYDNLTVIYGIATARSARAQAVSIPDKVESLGYYDNVFNICAGFTEEDTCAEIRRILTLPRNGNIITENGELFSYFFEGTGIVPQLNQIMMTYIDIADTFNREASLVVGSQISLYDQLQQHVIEARILSASGGGISKLIGGGDPLQYRDLSDILRDVCGRAAAFVESIVSRYFPDGDINNLHTLLSFIQYYYEGPSEDLFNELNFLWESNLYLLQNQADAFYNFDPSDKTSAVLTFLLSKIDATSQINTILPQRLDYYSLVNMHDYAVILLTLNLDGLQVSWEVTILLLLTLIDNIMNDPNRPSNISFFDIKKLAQNNFENKVDWDDLTRYIDSLLRYIQKGKISPVAVELFKTTKYTEFRQRIHRGLKGFIKRTISIIRGGPGKKGGTSNPFSITQKGSLHKPRKITQKRSSLHKKYNKTLKKNKRPVRKTRRRCN